MQLLWLLRTSAVHAVASKQNMKYGARPEAGVVEAAEVVRLLDVTCEPRG